MKLASGIFTLLVGIIISCVAAYFSIVGLAALFAAAGFSILIMGAALEIGKLVAATWLKANWGDKTIPFLHKSYLVVAVALLMAITSIGIYGFLAAGHLEQKAPLAGLTVESQQYETRLAQKTGENDRLIKRLDQIDQNIASFISQGAATRGLSASQSLKRERDQLSAQIDANNAEINKLNEQLAPLKAESGMVEAKLGPVKYLAQLIGYGNNPEVAVQIVILMIMIPFDPLALVLVLSGMITINQWRDERKFKAEPEADDDEEWGDLSAFGITGDTSGPDPFGLLKTDEPEPEQPRQVGLVGPSHAKPELTNEDPVIDTDEFWEVATRGTTITEPVEPESAITDEIDYAPEIEEPVVDEADIETTRREELIDMLEQDPSLISDLIAVVKDMENRKATPSDITGGKFD